VIMSVGKRSVSFHKDRKIDQLKENSFQKSGDIDKSEAVDKDRGCSVDRVHQFMERRIISWQARSVGRSERHDISHSSAKCLA
jgi:hypothetical protein